MLLCNGGNHALECTTMAGIKLATKAVKPAVETKPTFQYEVGKDEDVGEYKAGMFLKEPRVLKDFFALHIGAAGDETKARQLRETENPQFMAVVKAVTVEDGDASPLQQYVTAIMDAPFMTLNLEDIPTRANLKASGGSAYQWGQMAGKDFDDYLTEGVAHAREADAVPFLLRIKLVSIFGDQKDANNVPVMRTWPWMRSAYKGDGAKGNRAPAGYRLPSEKAEDNPLPVYNGPWMKYKTPDTVNGGDEQHDWSAEFTAGLPTGAYFADMVTVLKTKGVPERWPGTLSKEDIDYVTLLKKGSDPDKLAAKLKECAYEFSKRKSWVIAAIELDQSIERIQSWFTSGVRVDSYGQKQMKETADVAAKRRNPFCLSVKEKDSDGEAIRVYSEAVTKGKIINIGKRCHVGKGGIPANSGTGAILAPPPRKTAETKKDGGQTGERLSIDSTDKLLDAMQAFNVYIDVDGRRNTIMARGKQDKGALASAMRSAYANMTNIVTDATFVALADAYDKAQNDAVTAAKDAA